MAAAVASPVPAIRNGAGNVEDEVVEPVQSTEHESVLHASGFKRVNILKQGWLHKLSYKSVFLPLVRPLRRIFLTCFIVRRGKGWKKRFVEVTEDCELRYGRTGDGTRDMELKGVISLDDCDSAEVLSP